jgi:hypothetical protein
VTVLLKLVYAAGIAALFVFLLAFGVRTFYGPPEAPQFPLSPRFSPFPGAPGATPTPEQVQEQEEFEEAQEQYQREFAEYEDDLERYHSIVLAVSALAGVVGIAAGLFLDARLDAMRLGLAGGGLLALIYGVIQAEGDLDQLGAVAGFVIAAVGFAVILVAGYRWLDKREV